MKFMRKNDAGLAGFDDDPMASVANLFDVALVFIAALLFALMATFGKEYFQGAQTAKVNEKGQLELILRDGKRIQSLKQSDEKAAGRGVKLGVAYRLEDGTTIYVPEE